MQELRPQGAELPFAGVITARNIDIGSLITAAGATSAPVAGGDVAGAAGPGSLFRIAQTDTVRTYISVPESYSPSMTTGLTARVSPCRKFRGARSPGGSYELHIRLM